MTRSEFLIHIRNVCSTLPAAKVEKAVDTFFEFIESNLKSGNRLEIRGFGTFTLRQYSKKILRNPRTGYIVEKPVKGHIHFKAGKSLREFLNNQDVVPSSQRKD